MLDNVSTACAHVCDKLTQDLLVSACALFALLYFPVGNFSFFFVFFIDCLCSCNWSQIEQATRLKAFTHLRVMCIVVRVVKCLFIAIKFSPWNNSSLSDLEIMFLPVSKFPCWEPVFCLFVCFLHLTGQLLHIEFLPTLFNELRLLEKHVIVKSAVFKIVFFIPWMAAN